ncbi:MAG TPA: hypothetical protein GX725_00040 [Mollicutes bacterium]|jgi:hypothetical protein|nr:hypothetical protein [Mollicutes bacterium]
MEKFSDKYKDLKDEMFDLKFKLIKEKRVLSENETDKINSRLNEIRTLMKKELIDTMNISEGELTK